MDLLYTERRNPAAYTLATGHVEIEFVALD
jgi:hypothetical protein